jgi:hypothetical protein
MISKIVRVSVYNCHYAASRDLTTTNKSLPKKTSVLGPARRDCKTSRSRLDNCAHVSYFNPLPCRQDSTPDLIVRYIQHSQLTTTIEGPPFSTISNIIID